MAFVFDSLTPLLLFAACVSAWVLPARAWAPSRVNIRFAAMLFAALAAARMLGLLLPQYSSIAPAVALIAASLGATALGLGLLAFLARPVPAGAATLALGLSLGAGLAAVLSGAAVYALGCQLLGVSLTLAAGISAFAAKRPHALLSLMAALSLLCGGMALMAGTLFLADMFFAAALIGAARASQPLVETEAKPGRLALIGLRG
ncbi:MAG TPA: hypothetical protein VNW15_09195 [Rhizomicrobium sp.]|jgi:hypothetical protein|nr:hypothetical protein [Rhizomicrobium sp.]